MDKREMVKALNRIYLVLELSESVHAQIEHGDDWENKALMRESILTLMGQQLDDEKRERQRTDSREFSIWNYSIMYQCIGHFKDICSWILMNPTLTEEYPPVFGHLFGLVSKIESRYLDGITAARAVADVLIVWDEKIPDKDLEEMAGIFLIENKCIGQLRKIPRLKDLFDEAEAALMPSDDELMRVLTGFAGKLPSA